MQRGFRDTKFPEDWQSQAVDLPDEQSVPCPRHPDPFSPCCSVTRAPEPSHQPASNWIILMSLVVLPTYTKVNTHKKVLERKDRSAARSRGAEGSCHCRGRPAWGGGTELTAWQLLFKPTDETTCSAWTASIFVNFLSPMAEHSWGQRMAKKGFICLGSCLHPRWLVFINLSQIVFLSLPEKPCWGDSKISSRERIWWEFFVDTKAGNVFCYSWNKARSQWYASSFPSPLLPFYSDLWKYERRRKGTFQKTDI